MPDDGSNWPLPKFYFNLKWDSEEVAFQEVSGLDTEAPISEYQHGNSPGFSSINMPSSTIILRKGVFTKDNKFWDWYNEIQMNTIKRKTVRISLLDETGAPTMVWTLSNAWPIKMTATDLNSASNEITIETLEFAHEGLIIENG